jgi:hypothetical protein
MLDNHPMLTLANDTHFIIGAAKRELQVEPDPPMTAELAKQVIRYRRFYRLGVEEQEAYAVAEQCQRYSEFVSALYTLRGQKQGKPLSGEKTPDYCRRLRVIKRLCPDSRIVHIIRDGRDTALSLMQWATKGKGPGRLSLWSEDPVATCALWWRRKTGTGVRQGRALDSKSYREIHYEALVAQPRTELAAVAEFLDIPDTKEMAEFYRGKTRNNPRLSAKSAWLPPTVGLRDWRRDMAEKDIETFEIIAGELLEQLGYDRVCNNPGVAATERAQLAEQWWANRYL